MSTKSPMPPSPGPVFPGAWPSSRRRSNTCPTPRPRPVVDPLHLACVLDFQQRLVNQMDQSGIPSSDSAIVPIDSLDSDLTRFRMDTSTSMITDTSVCTTPERSVTGNLFQLASGTKSSTMESNYPTRIPRPSTRRVSPRNDPKILSDSSSPPHHPVTFSESPSPPRRPVPPASSFSLGYTSNGSPLSPIVFSSPTSSAFPRFASNSQPSPSTRSLSYDYDTSPSWETSYGSEYNDRYMLGHSPSPSPSPLSGRPSLAPRMSTTNRTPSIEINASVPMLTNLSLPASPDNSMSIEMNLVSRSPRLSPVDGNASPWSLSLSPVSPLLSVVPDLSLSPPPDEHVVYFPSSPFDSPLPSPVLDENSGPENVGNTSAAEYAAAVMSSAWASDGPSMTIPRGPLLNETEVNAADEDATNADASMDVTVDEVEPPASLPYTNSAENIPARFQERKKQSVVDKMKNLGHRVKRMLRGKPNAVSVKGGVSVNVDVRVGRLSSSRSPDDLPDGVNVQSNTATAQAYNHRLPLHDNSSHLPLPLPPPPGLLIRKSKPRPILASHMEESAFNSRTARSRTNENLVSQATPSIRIRPPSSSGISPAVVPKAPSPDLTVHSRPKTLAEIKSKRRLSLSTLSTTFTRSSSSMNVPASSNRPRPSSALAFYPRPPSASSFRGAPQGNATSSNLLSVPASTSARTVPPTETAGSGRIPASTSSTLPRSHQDAKKKKNRRFSLSALSSFAAGNWEEGFAQRNGVQRLSSHE